MSIIQFLRIFWARRAVVVVATVCCLVGAVIVVTVIPPSWKASSRVLVNVSNPDLITGQDPNAARGAVETQMALATDYSVAGKVVDDLGLASDPGLIAAYEKRSKGGGSGQDFRRTAIGTISQFRNPTRLAGQSFRSVRLASLAKRTGFDG